MYSTLYNMNFFYLVYLTEIRHLGRELLYVSVFVFVFIWEEGSGRKINL